MGPNMVLKVERRRGMARCAIGRRPRLFSSPWSAAAGRCAAVAAAAAAAAVVATVGPFCTDLGPIWGPSWAHYGHMLDPFWAHFGSIHGPMFGALMGPSGAPMCPS
jgi:hypothetical protein